MTSTEIAERDAAALVEAQAVADQIAASQAQEYEGETLSTPIIKVGQGLTKEVQNGDAEVGEFIFTLTNKSLGTAIEFINGFYQKGRFASEKKTGRAWVTFSDTIPASWSDYVGEEFVGTPFAEHPESEEVFTVAANNGEHEWGSGPGISTTHNYTGLVLDEGGEPQPARLSLKRTDKPAHRKLQSLYRAVLRNKPPWDAVVRLSTTPKDYGQHTTYVIDPTAVQIVRKAEPNEQLFAAQVALAAEQGRAQAVGAEDALADTPVEPKAPGALDIG